MERKTSATEEDGEEDISHGGIWRGRHQPRRKTERKTSASGEDAEEDISHGGICRGRHQPRRKMERKRAATTRRTEDCPSGPAPLSSVQTKNTRRGNVCRSLSMHVQLCANKKHKARQRV